jgi:Rieske Fe-S protein
MEEATVVGDYSGCAARRAVLLGLTTAGVVTLAGCNKADDPYAAQADTAGVNGPGVAEQSGGSPSAQPSGSAEPSGEPFPSGQGGAAGLVRTSDVPVGGAVLVAEMLVAQPQRGVFKAYSAVCPHQGVTVDPPANGANFFMCPGHNSKFKVADGAKISGPTPRGLSVVAVKVKDGYVVRA